MSLDVYLEGPSPRIVPSDNKIFIRENGAVREISLAEWQERFPGSEPIAASVETDMLYSANITHNLREMANAADIYKHLWRPDEIGITHARALVEPLRASLKLLLAEPCRFKAFNPDNGWGDYDGLVRFVRDYLAACEENPDAIVKVSR